MISDGSGPIGTVGLAVGYSDPSTFGRVFKRYEGVSPRTIVRLVQKYPELKPILRCTVGWRLVLQSTAADNHAAVLGVAQGDVISKLRRTGFCTPTKTPQEFDFERLHSLDHPLLHKLAGGANLTDRAPVLITGPCGTGKSHLAQALSQRAVQQGVDVLFATCSDLTTCLNASRALGTYDCTLGMLARIPLLCIEDFGQNPLWPPADEDVHNLILERYEQRSTVVTSSLDLREWDEVFPAKRWLASATLGRLRHNAYCITLDGESLRATHCSNNRASDKPGVVQTA